MKEHVTVYFVRHGQTDWNAAQRLQGRTDIPLNDHGRSQARRNGAALVEHLPVRHGKGWAGQLDFVASPLARTRETMAIVRTHLGLAADDFRTDPRLMEMSYGQWEGETWPRMRTDRPPEVDAWLANIWHGVPPGGESYAMVQERVVAWLGEIERDTVVVAHGGVMRVLRGHLRALAPDETTRLDVPQDKVLVLKRGGEQWL